jgi:hypothetical protein
MSYERKIIHGIPFFVKGADLYGWISADGCSDAGNNVHESTNVSDCRTMLKLGIYDADTNTLELDGSWLAAAQPKLDDWRKLQVSRSRALLRRTAATTNTTTTATATATK